MNDTAAAKASAGRGRAVVAQPLLDGIERRSRRREFGCHHRPQTLGMNAPGDSGAPSQSGEHAADVSRRHPATGNGTEKRGAKWKSEGASHVDPALQESQFAGVEGGGPRPAPFALEDADDASVKVEVFSQKRQRLRDPQPAPVEGDDQGPVSDAGGRVC